MAAEVAVRQGFGTIVLDIRRGDGPKSAFHYTMATIAATERSLKERPGLVGAVQRAMQRAHAALAHDLSLATKVGRNLFPAAEAELIAELIRRDLPFYDTRILPEDFASLDRFACDMGLKTGEASYQNIVAHGNSG
jgi:NitT/TauT family transport system substrate-binding protein